MKNAVDLIGRRWEPVSKPKSLINIGPAIVYIPLLIIYTAMYQTSNRSFEVAIYGKDTAKMNKTACVVSKHFLKDILSINYPNDRLDKLPTSCPVIITKVI